MTEIEEEGFLSEEAVEGKAVFRDRFSDILALAKDMNRVAMQKLQEVKLGDAENGKFILYLLTVRVIESFQAIVILMEYGMVSSAKLIMRPLLEAMFSLSAMQKDESLVDRYYDTQDKAHMDLLKYTAQWKDEVLRVIRKERKFEEIYIKKKQVYKENPPQVFRPIDWARAADYEDLYNVYYVYYASFTHSNLSALEDHIERDGEGSVEASFGPSVHEFYDVLRQAVAFTLISVMHMSMAFKIDMDNDSERIHDGLTRLDEKYNANGLECR